MKLDKALKTSLDELRMQMLGLQVLFGFEFQALFQTGFADLPESGRLAEAMGLVLILLALAVLVAVPSQHRIIEEGEASERIYRLSTRFGKLALWPLAGAIASGVFVPLSRCYGDRVAVTVSAVALLLTFTIWQGVGFALRRHLRPAAEQAMESAHTPLSTKIEQMLTESRVILPGAQALLGFQLVVMMTKAFDALPDTVRQVHVTGLLCLALAVVLLIAPAALHRIAFDGEEDPRMHRLGSFLITAALLPFATGIACDVYVAFFKLFSSGAIALIAALGSLALLGGLWYLLPLGMRPAARRPASSH